MTHLRKIMLEELQRRDYSNGTIRSCLRYVERFAKHFGADRSFSGIQRIDFRGIQPAVQDGEDGRTTGKACAVLLFAAGGRTLDESTVRDDATQDRAVAASGKLNGRRQRRQSESRRAKEDG